MCLESVVSQPHELNAFKAQLVIIIMYRLENLVKTVQIETSYQVTANNVSAL